MNIFTTSVGVLTQIIVARSLKSETYGNYIYAYTWLGILSLLGSMGMNNTLLKYNAIYRSNFKWAELHGVIRFSNLIASSASISISIVSAIILVSFRSLLSELLYRTMFIGILLVPIYSLTQIRQSTLQSMLYVVRSNLPEKIIKPFLLIIFLTMIYHDSSKNLSAPKVMILDGISITIAFIVGIIFLQILMPKIIWKVKPKYFLSNWLDASFPFLLISLINMILNKSGIIILGYYCGTEKAGIYSIGLSLSNFIAFGMQSLNTVFAPIIASLYSEKKLFELKKLIKISLCGTLFISIPITLIFIFYGDKLLSIYGPIYKISYNSFIILVVSQNIITISGPVGYLMTMTGHHHKTTKYLLLGLILNFILNMILIPKYEMLGASISYLFSTIFWNAMMCYWVSTKMKINTTVLALLSK